MLSRAFGLSLDFDPLPPGAWVEVPARGAVLRVREVAPAEVAEHWSGREAVEWEATIDGERFVAERGVAGDHRFAHGDRAAHLLSADGASLSCASDDAAEVLRWRVVLDSVLFCAALLRGHDALHAGAVATAAGAVAIVAGAGGGKSTLLAELLGRGCGLLADDVVVLEGAAGGAPLAHPGPPLMTVPERVDPLPGSLLAPVGEERWLAVPAVPEPLPLAAVVILDRRPGLATELRPVERPLAPLLASLLRFPRNPEREGGRFETAAAIAARVPIWQLGAEPEVAPGVLAELVQERVGAGAL